MKQLLDLFVRSIYSSKEVFLRELISNASDALTRVQYRMLADDQVADAGAELAIQLFVDPAEGTLIVREVSAIALPIAWRIHQVA
jgi:molecular chaperone HtpG